jgi:hypothetical protein
MPVHFHPYNPIESLEERIIKEDGSPLHGEIDIYRKLFSDLSVSKDDWHVWHDLKLPSHSESFNYYHKTSAQIDFLVLSKQGIIVFEVKGGPVSMKDNIFYYGRNFDAKMGQDPFRQVEGYKHTLKDKILNNVKGCFFCDAVAFPHVDYSFESKIFDSNILWSKYRSSHYEESIELFINSVFEYTKMKHELHFRKYPILNQNEINAIIKVLSPIVNDENKYSTSSTLEWLQVNNLEILDSLYKNQRIMIEGPPGSGKTTIAKAFIDQQMGKKGLYLCWNNLLMHYTKHIINERNRIDEIEVTTFFRFIEKLSPDIEKEYLFNINEEGFYSIVKESVAELKRQGKLPTYDFIVIDEGQDTFDRGSDIIMNELCGYNHSGLINGNILILYDIDQSYNEDGRNVLDIADLMIGYFAHFKLNEVKRSAQNPFIRLLSEKILQNPSILLQTSFQSEFENIYISKHPNLESVKKFIVNKIIMQLRDEHSSLRGNDCVLLIESSLLRGSYQEEPDMHYFLTIKDVEELNDTNITDRGNILRYTSILKFKGLEKSNVFLVITEPSDKNKYELYIGITRAINNLEILIIL